MRLKKSTANCIGYKSIQTSDVVTKESKIQIRLNDTFTTISEQSWNSTTLTIIDLDNFYVEITFWRDFFNEPIDTDDNLNLLSEKKCIYYFLLYWMKYVNGLLCILEHNGALSLVWQDIIGNWQSNDTQKLWVI